MRKTIIVLVCLLAALFGLYAGFRGYKAAKIRRLIVVASSFRDKADDKNALLSLRQALISDPSNMEAIRLMANLCEESGSRAAILWKSRLVELNPRSLEDRINLAKTAMNYGDIASATNALGGVDAAGKATFEYHMAAGAVAAAENMFPAAEGHFAEAARLQPQSLFALLNVAVIQIRSTNAATAAEARLSLNSIRSNPTNSTLRCQAIRELALEANRRGAPGEALDLCGDLLREPSAVFADRLLQLELLRAQRSPRFQDALESCQRDAALDPGKISQLGLWKMAKIGPNETLQWLLVLPSQSRTNQSVSIMIADARTQIGDWKNLKIGLDNQNWAELEFYRHALLSRALRGEKLAESSKAEWELAMKAANGQGARLIMLLRMVAHWDWGNEAEEVLWSLVRKFPEERWAVSSLTRLLMNGGRTRSIMQLFSEELKRNPQDVGTKNNVAMTALLLGASELNPLQLATEAYEKSSNAPPVVSTYALALHLKGRDTEALKAIEQLRPEDLKRPEYAGYYGLVLKATGDKAKAKIYLDLSKSAMLLPEERLLFERAMVGL
jgi:predicted Zn-dependent protease